ncbi:MAG: SH3-like domain-containing protein [Vulcanimicrobiaceae bacterium]
MSARFAPGDPVRVRQLETHGHVRTPRYVRGKRGVVERLCGAFRNPEELAYGRWNGLPLPLYRIRFAQCELWPDYGGPAGDTVDVELYEHWLEPAEERA